MQNIWCVLQQNVEEFERGKSDWRLTVNVLGSVPCPVSPVCLSVYLFFSFSFSIHLSIYIFSIIPSIYLSPYIQVWLPTSPNHLFIVWSNKLMLSDLFILNFLFCVCMCVCVCVCVRVVCAPKCVCGRQKYLTNMKEHIPGLVINLRI